LLPKLPSSGDGASGTGAGFGGFFITVFFFTCLAFFIPFFLRVGAPRFAFLDFFATVTLPIGLTKLSVSQGVVVCNKTPGINPGLQKIFFSKYQPALRRP
jgi:hypothetical protein